MTDAKDSGDFARKFDPNATKHSIPEGKTTAEVLADQRKQEDIEWEARKRVEPKLVQQVYDDWNDMNTFQHQASPTNEPTAADRDEEAKAQRELAREIMKGINDLLGGQGLKPWKCIPNGHGTGFELTVRDSIGRRYDVALNFDELTALTARAQTGTEFRALLTHVCEEVLRAREKYHARMH